MTITPTPLAVQLEAVGWSPVEAAALLEGRLPRGVDASTVVTSPTLAAIVTMASDGAATLYHDPYAMAQLGLALTGMSAVLLYRMDCTDTGDAIHQAASVLAEVLDRAVG